ncbi:hypothetical protein E2C01_084842 [Portunus trituberculatus]|uniref:Uncharacterized protein n=1 Tax=Portunus trituberculatus TaxID=210409 RepID=A0A5B7J577_PORTR|nr:hypothetical protein [Portunus trituberculatus]
MREAVWDKVRVKKAPQQRYNSQKLDYNFTVGRNVGITCNGEGIKAWTDREAGAGPAVSSLYNSRVMERAAATHMTVQ